jgi:heme/copper-type cytochrome/quinol oxidase subunit 1
LRALQTAAAVLTALALVPGGAHFFEMPNKIGLPEKQYFIAQSIYRGWALFGIVIFAAIGANLLVALLLYRRRKPFWLSLSAGLILAGTLVVFFAWTYPANQATANWTAVPADWQTLRVQWEVSHAANAVLTLIALCCAAVSSSRGLRCGLTAQLGAANAE